MIITAIKTRLFREREDLASFVAAHLKKVPERSVLVIASKIVALSEGRTVPRAAGRTYARLVSEESAAAMKTRHAWLTVKDGMVMANAGIDESNAGGRLVLLPEDCFASAERLRKELKKAYRVEKLGVVISDSSVSPLRAGVTAHAVGYAGMKGVRDYRGRKDLSGRKMKISRTNVADSIATAAALAMGEGAERRPLALVTDAPVEFAEKIDRNETCIAPEDDLFHPFLKSLERKN